MRKIISRVLSVAAAAVLLLTAMPALSDNAEKAPEIPGINDALMEINPSPYIGLGSITDNPFSDSDDSLNESLSFNIQLHSGNPNLSESIHLTISRNRDSDAATTDGNKNDFEFTLEGTGFTSPMDMVRVSIKESTVTFDVTDATASIPIKNLNENKKIAIKTVAPVFGTSNNTDITIVIKSGDVSNALQVTENISGGLQNTAQFVTTLEKTMYNDNPAVLLLDTKGAVTPIGEGTANVLTSNSEGKLIDAIKYDVKQTASGEKIVTGTQMSHAPDINDIYITLSDGSPLPESIALGESLTVMLNNADVTLEKKWKCCLVSNNKTYNYSVITSKGASNLHTITTSEGSITNNETLEIEYSYDFYLIVEVYVASALSLTNGRQDYSLYASARIKVILPDRLKTSFDMPGNVISIYCNADPQHRDRQPEEETTHLCDTKSGGCGNLYPCKESEAHRICTLCEKPVCNTENGAHSAPCGNTAHSPCVLKDKYLRRNHEKCPNCGKFKCKGGKHSRCSVCSGYMCGDRKHSMLPCGNCCEKFLSGEHGKCSGSLGCGGWKCDGKDHSGRGCDHCKQAKGDHSKCQYCDSFKCYGGKHGDGICNVK